MLPEGPKSIQDAVDTGDVRRMCGRIKKATGPPTSKIAPLKAKAGLELYATQNEVSRSALDSIPDMPIMEELDVLRTIEELDKAINTFANRKAPGADGVPPETLKTGKPVLMQHLYELLCLCWEKGYVPQDMRDAIIVTLYKNKGDCSNCNN